MKTLVGGLLGLGLVGCGPELGMGSAEPVISPAPVSSEAAPEGLSEHERMLADFAAGLGIADPPEVEVVRVVHPFDFFDAYEACMIEEGWGPDANGNYTTTTQGEALRLSTYVCTARYPKDERYTQPFSEGQQRVIYDYFVSDLIPCLGREGHVIPEPPTWEAFRDAIGTADEFVPYNFVTASDELQDACPFYPPRDVLWAD